MIILQLPITDYRHRELRVISANASYHVQIWNEEAFWTDDEENLWKTLKEFTTAEDAIAFCLNKYPNPESQFPYTPERTKVTTQDGWEFELQPDGNWVSADGGGFSYCPTDGFFISPDGEVIQLTAAEDYATDKYVYHGVVTVEAMLDMGYWEVSQYPGYVGKIPDPIGVVASVEEAEQLHPGCTVEKPVFSDYDQAHVFNEKYQLIAVYDLGASRSPNKDRMANPCIALSRWE